MAVNFLAFKGAEGDQRIFLSTFDGNSWTGLSPLDGANSSHGPALAVFGGRLFTGWKGVEGDQRVFLNIFDGVFTQPQPFHIGPNVVSSICGPALAAFNDQLYVVYNENQAVVVYPLQTDPTIHQVSIGGSAAAPAVARFNDRVSMAWRGVEGDQRLVFQLFDGDGTHLQQFTVQDQESHIPGANSSHGPALARG